MEKKKAHVILNTFQDLILKRFRIKSGMTVLLTILLSLVILTSSVSAATLSTAKDSISTSRPSASVPISVDQAANESSVSIFDNNSMFLASDSATIIPDTGETINTAMRVASMSAQNTVPLPLSYWKFDEGTGSTVNDSISTNNGTWGGTLGSQWATGEISTGASFNGTDNYVTVGGSLTPFQTDTKTVSFWANPASTISSNKPVISLNGANWYLGFNATNNMFVSYSIGAGTQQTLLSSGSFVVPGQWHYYTYVFSVSGGNVTITFYMDGISHGGNTFATGYSSAYGGNLYFGAFNSSSFFYNGKMDEISIWNTELSQSQIAYLYNNGVGRQYPGFLAGRTVYFTSTITNAHHAGDPVIVPITAKHTLSFTTITGVASTGKVVVTFPGTGTNSASPSASTFAFNNLQSSNISTTGASCGSYSLSPPTITCNLNAALSPGTLVTMTIGSSTPALVNPTKSAVAGTSDPWQLTLQTTDSGGVILDSATIRIATIDSITVRGEVDPSITFTISGVNNGVALSTQATGCADSTANVPNSTASEVSLGFLRNGQINLGAQLLTVSTNGSQGYAISATSSGRMLNPSTGYGIYGLNGDIGLSNNDTPVPAVFRASGLDGFGISACGPRINTTLWGATSCTTAFSSGCKYANPWNTGTNSYYDTIASYSGGPVSNDATVVKYGGTISGTTPPGSYRTVFTYVATATF